jgi:pyruvate kinase
MNNQPINDSTQTISWVSYILHLIVAVSAVIPGAQMGPALLVVALIIDLVKKGDTVVLTSGEPMGEPGGTNTLKIIHVK